MPHSLRSLLRELRENNVTLRHVGDEFEAAAERFDDPIQRADLQRLRFEISGL